jgi:TetR/AcrR family acrAB operon transcriptional repressor
MQRYDNNVMAHTARDESPTTRDSLLELAANRFVADGYARTSVRDLARESDRTTGALYGHFRNKADLLAEVIAARIAHDLEGRIPPGVSLAEGVVGPWRHYRERAGLRALLLEGAAAARQDESIRERLGEQQAEKLAEWAAMCREAVDREVLDATPDLDALFTVTWALEVGIGVLEAYGIEPPDGEFLATMVARLIGTARRDQPGRPSENA